MFSVSIRGPLELERLPLACLAVGSHHSLLYPVPFEVRQQLQDPASMLLCWQILIKLIIAFVVSIGCIAVLVPLAWMARSTSPYQFTAGIWCV